MGINPFSLEDESFSRRNGIQRSAYPKMQISSPGSRFSVKTTRSGRGRKYFREGYSRKADNTKTIVKSSFIRRNKDSTRHIIQHIDYMMKSKIDHEREPDTRKLFNRDGQEISRDEGIDIAMRNRGEVAGHKLILSPGVNDIDLVDYARDQMSVLEERLGVKMQYSFAYQKNTDNYHIHVQVPGRGDRIFDTKNANGRERIDIKLGKDDFAAMREAGDKYLAKHLFLDRATDKVVELDLLRDTHGPEARLKQNDYDRSARRDLGLELTSHDYQVLKELGVEVPYRPPSFQKQKNGRLKQETKVPARDLGDAHFGDELSSYLKAYEYKLKNNSSEVNFERVLELVDTHPWLFPDEGQNRDEFVFKRHTSIEEVRNDPRYEHFVKGVDSLVRLEGSHRAYEELRSGEGKGMSMDDFHKISVFFKSKMGERIYEKFLDTQKDGEQFPERFDQLNQTIDETLSRYSRHLEDKFGLTPDARGDDREPDIFAQSESVLRRLEAREKDLGDCSRVLGYRTSGDFVESFERLLRLSEGKEAIPEFSSEKHKLTFLADKLMQPEYAEHKSHAELLKLRGFQLYSSYATRDEFSNTKDQIRERQFALDSKIYDLNEARLIEFRQEYESREMKMPRSRFEGAAENHMKLYEQALVEDNTRQRDLSQGKFHQAVMKHDDETLLLESSLLPKEHQIELERIDGKADSRDEKTDRNDFDTTFELGSVDSEFKDELDRGTDALVQGHSLPLPGFDLDRLDRDGGAELTHDPTEIQVSITIDDELRRRRDEDEEAPSL